MDEEELWERMGGSCRAAPALESVLWVFTCCECEVGGLVSVMMPATLDTKCCAVPWGQFGGGASTFSGVCLGSSGLGLELA